MCVVVVAVAVSVVDCNGDSAVDGTVVAAPLASVCVADATVRAECHGYRIAQRKVKVLQNRFA